MKEYKLTFYRNNEPYTVTVSKAEYWENIKTRYCEKIGIYEIYRETLKTITYYSYFGYEGFYKITKNLETGKQKRQHMKWNKAPAFLLVDSEINGKPFQFTKYNYFCG